MDNLDEIICSVMQKEIYVPTEFEETICNTLNDKKNNRIYSTIIKTISTILAFITITASVVFAKDISNFIRNVFHPFAGAKNLNNVMEIANYMPKDVTKIILINNMSDKNNPTTYEITEVKKMESFMELFTKSSWNEIKEKEIYKFAGAFWEIHIIGEYESIIKMKGIGGNDNHYGIVVIEANETVKSYYIAKEIYLDILAFTNEKYSLHDSKLEIPIQDRCFKAQKIALKDLSQEEIKNLQENIRLIHLYLESELVDGVRLIKDKNSPYWEDFTSYGVFKDPFTEIEVINGGRFLKIYDELQKIKNISKNESVRKDLQKASDILKEGMNEHNLEKCFEAHKIVHDYDYFVINTPLSLDVPPTDWEGINNYFGKVSIME